MLSVCYCAYGQYVRPSELSCVYSMRPANNRPHERSREKYYECDSSGVYKEKQCQPGHVYNSDSSVHKF